MGLRHGKAPGIPNRMSKNASEQHALDGIPGPTLTLVRLLEEIGCAPTVARSVEALSLHRQTGDVYLRIAHAVLPGRRPTRVQDAAALLGDTVSTRVALLAAGAAWIRDLLRGHTWTGPLLRHSFASATAAEAVSRDAGSLAPLCAYAMGLLHHLGDAVRLGGYPGNLGGHETALLQQAGAPDWMREAILGYSNSVAEAIQPGRSVEMDTLAAADFAATAFGYAAPFVAHQPWTTAGDLALSKRLFASSRRVVATVEDLVSVVIDASRPPSASGSLSGLSPVVMADVLEGVSTRDLGPLPVLFSRISSSSDYDSLAVSLTAGVVEELEVPRAWFLLLENDRILTGGALSARGAVTHSLDLRLKIENLPRALHMALKTNRPIMHPSSQLFGLEDVVGNKDSDVLFVPVGLGKESLGILGVELEAGVDLVPDLLAAVAAHAGLALKAIRLKQLSDDALKDELTGLYNRRGILQFLDEAIATADAKDQSVGIALLDCDHLKKVNDNFGHLMGDEFVRRISEVCRSSLRATDSLGRYGGDEFLAVMPLATLEETEHAMERARRRVEETGYASEDGLLLSISVGAVVRTEGPVSRETLLKLADSALYRSKERGRNAVTIVTAGLDPSIEPQ